MKHNFQHFWHHSIVTNDAHAAVDIVQKYQCRPTLTKQYMELHSTLHSFNGPLSRTTRVGRYQKGKTNLDFTEA